MPIRLNFVTIKVKKKEMLVLKKVRKITVRSFVSSSNQKEKKVK